MHARQLTRSTVIALGCALTVVTSIAAQAPTVELGKRTARSQYAFGRVSDAKELPDGRVIASDGKERAFQIVDFAKGTMSILGETGDGPNMYSFAETVLSAAGDSLLLYAGSSRTGLKFLKVSPAGAIVEPVNVFRDTTRTRIMSSPVGVDSHGRVYFLSPMVRMDSNRFTTLPQTTIARIAPGVEAIVDVDTISSRRANQIAVPGVTPQGTIFPYLFRDAWAVRRDGLGAHVVADGYEVIWSRDGKITGRTGPLPTQAILLNESEQQAYRDSVIEARRPRPQTSAPDGSGGAPRGVAAMGTMGGGGGGGRSGVPMPPPGANGQAPAPVPISFAPFPEKKPAILPITAAVMFDGNGNLWIAKERAHGDAVLHFDVVAEGKGVIAHVNLPAGTRLISVGKQALYLVRVEDSQEWLERYPLPKF